MMQEQEKFWKPEPREPWQDWRTWGMFIPLLASMLGFAFTGLFAFAFSDISVIAAGTQSWMVIVGSALIVWGAEANTPFTVIEVFRKILRKEHNLWDISALVASLTGTAINLLVTFASRQTLFGDSVWRQWSLSWGPLVAGIAVTLDYYGGMIELGFLFGSYEIRLTEYNQWLTQTGQSVIGKSVELIQLLANLEKMGARLSSLEREIEKMGWPVARVGDFEKIRAGMNGHGDQMTAEKLEVELDQRQMRMPSPSTVERWLT